MNELDAISDDEEGYSNTLQSRLWLQFWGYAQRYPRDLFWLGVCAVVTAAMEISYPLITRAVIDTVAAGANSSALWQYGVLYVLTTIVITVSIGGFIRIGGKLNTRISHDIRKDGFANLQALSFSYFNHRPVGWLMARMTSDCDRLSNILVWGFSRCCLGQHNDDRDYHSNVLAASAARYNSTLCIACSGCGIDLFSASFADQCACRYRR